MTQSALIEMEPLQPAPRQPPSDLVRKIQSVECEIDDLRWQLDCAEDELERLREKVDVWPDKTTLLAVYGAPGNWPVEPA